MKPHNTKSVEYFGIQLIVPGWVTCLAVGQSGALHYFDADPCDLAPASAGWWVWKDGCERRVGAPVSWYMFHVDLEGVNWEDSMAVVND